MVEPDKFLKYCAGIAIVLFALGFLQKQNSGWKSNIESKKEIAAAKEECAKRAEEVLPGFSGGGLTQLTIHNFDEETGDCYAMRMSQNKNYQSAYFVIYDAWLNEELARLHFGCKEDCMSLEEFLDVERDTFGEEDAQGTLDTLESWEEDYGKAPR